MKPGKAAPRVETIPIDQIRVVNPRQRNAAIHRGIVENIHRIGLKRPVTVCPRPAVNGKPQYDLAFGQGRMEAFQMLGQKRIPAIVREASEHECILMGLVENVARRQLTPVAQLREIANLKGRGNSEAQIAERLGVSESWVGMIVLLLERGEERLLAAADTGRIPISLAVEIARADSKQSQQLLADAYERGELTGRKLAQARRLLERRTKSSKLLMQGTPGSKAARKKMTAEELRKVFEREARRQALIKRKADFTHERLLFLTEAFRDLCADRGFMRVLAEAGAQRLPRVLADRIAARAAA